MVSLLVGSSSRKRKNKCCFLSLFQRSTLSMFETKPFMKINSKRGETESGMQLRSIRDQNDPSIASKLEPFMKINPICGK